MNGHPLENNRNNSKKPITLLNAYYCVVHRLKCIIYTHVFPHKNLGYGEFFVHL